MNGQYEEEMEDPEVWSVVPEKLGASGSVHDGLWDEL